MGGVVADDVGLRDEVDGDRRQPQGADGIGVGGDEPLSVLLVALQDLVAGRLFIDQDIILRRLPGACSIKARTWSEAV